MKIVVTLTVEAYTLEQAETVADHVAVFLPDDARRVARAFAPVLSAPGVGVGVGGSPRGEAAHGGADAAVITVVRGTPTVPPAAALPPPEQYKLAVGGAGGRRIPLCSQPTRSV